MIGLGLGFVLSQLVIRGSSRGSRKNGLDFARQKKKKKNKKTGRRPG